MKLLIISQHFYPETFFINDVVFLLSKKGFKVKVITSKPNYQSNKIYEGYNKFGIIKNYINGVKIYWLPIISRGKKFNFIRRVFNYASFILSSVYCYIFLKNEIKDSDIVLSFASSPIFQVYAALFYKSKIGIPHVMWLQDLWPHNLIDIGINNKILNKFINWNVLKIYNKSDLILCQSKGFMKILSSQYNIKHIKLLHNPSLDINLKKKNIINFTNKNKKILIYTGNLGLAQPLEDFIIAFEKLENKRDFLFYIIGSGVKKEKLVKMIKAKKLNKYILMKHWLPKDELSHLIKISHTLVLPLIPGSGYSYTIPGKFQFYLKFKIPILSYSDGVTYDYVKNNKLGYAIKYGDIDTLSNVISNISKKNKKEISLIKLNIEKFSKKFDLNLVTNKLINYLNFSVRNF